jgi:hypothetical protein
MHSTSYYIRQAAEPCGKVRFSLYRNVWRVSLGMTGDILPRFGYLTTLLAWILYSIGLWNDC